MTTTEIKPAKVCYVFAALALLAGLGLLIAGCHPLPPSLTERETQCAAEPVNADETRFRRI